MSTHQKEHPMASLPPVPATTRSGVVTFAGVMMLLAAALNLLDGIVALLNDDHYAIDELLFGDLTAWGVWWLLVAAIQGAIGLAIVRRSSLGAIAGITVAGVNALTQLMFIGAYPAWSIAVIVVDGVIIYALTAHLEEFD
jgi:hypothetical protein